MEKEMEKEKNIINMVTQNLKDNIYMDKDGLEKKMNIIITVD